MGIRTISRGIALSGLAASTLVLGACATETSYRPATGSGFARTGYSEQQIERDRFLVSFSGNSYTSRETVDRYLLLRAAELTVQQGADYFVLVERDTDRQTRTYATPSFGGYGAFGPYGAWGSSWRYRGRGFGWRSWSPFYGDPFFDREIDIRTIDRFEANAEIVIGRGPKPAGNMRAFDARGVIDTVGPTAVLPR